jgi:hypothetical protein
MTNVITVEIKNNYGNEAIYPVSECAVLFTRLTGKKTLSREDISIIKTLGFMIELKQATL